MASQSNQTQVTQGLSRAWGPKGLLPEDILPVQFQSSLLRTSLFPLFIHEVVGAAWACFSLSINIGFILVRVLQRNRTNRMCVYIQCVCTHIMYNVYTYNIYVYICVYVCIYIYIHIFRDIYFKELAHVITEADQSKICRVAQQARDPKTSPCCSSNPKAIFWQNFLLLGGFSLLFYSGLQLFGQGPPTLWRTICFTQSPLI